MSDEWLISETRPLDGAALRQIERETATGTGSADRGTSVVPRLAVLLRQVICHDVHKMFGAAEVRLDALVVHGRGQRDRPDSFYMPGTFRFADMHDHQQLPIDPSHGLLIFNGKPAHFLDIFIVASRDRQDSDDLATLLRGALSAPKTQAAVGALFALGAAAPPAAAISAGIEAAAALGDLAYRVIRAMSDKTIGMYRGSFLQYRDDFGVGRHPVGEAASFMENNLQFWFETVLDQAPSSA
jgi:hypothetical protein